MQLFCLEIAHGSWVQVACTVLSSDQQHQADVLGIIGASLALNLSDIPFNAVLSGVRVGMKDDQFILNPTFDEVEASGFFQAATS